MVKEPKNRSFAATQWAVGEVDQLFITFARYTRFVLVSKWFLAILAVLMLGGLIAWPLLTNDKSGMRLSFVSSDAPQKIANPVMDAPNFVGSSKNNEQYSISGIRAIQQSPQLVLIEKPQGQLLKVDGSLTSIRAQTALFHQDTKIVELSDDVNLFDDKGNLFTTSKATVNVNTMDADGAEPVEGTGPNGKLVATGFKIRNSGKVISFGSAGTRVNVHIDKMRQDK